MKKLVKKIKIAWFEIVREICIRKSLKKKIKNRSVSIISQNCIGGVVSHDCGIRFNSPTINLWMPAKDFILFVENLRDNLDSEIEDVSYGNLYPVGLLNHCIHIHFLHYKSFKEAQDKWNERKKRVDFNNLRVVLCENDGCDYTDLVRFDKLPYKKVVFTHKVYENVKCSFCIHGFEKEKNVPNMVEWKGCFGEKFIDAFDWISFLNDEK